jgi:hypothetical protein
VSRDAEEQSLEMGAPRPNVETDLSDDINVADLKDRVEATTTQRICHAFRKSVLP